MKGKGYWEGKSRDANTIKKLTESKYKKYVQYDKDGRIIKIWESGKEIALKVFGDYNLKGNKSQIYEITKSLSIKGRFRHNSYWFSEVELLIKYAHIPNKIDIDKIYSEQKKKRSMAMRESNKRRKNIRQYSVIQYDKAGNIINKYDNAFLAAEKLGSNVKTIRQLCKGNIFVDGFDLKYGEKISQPFGVKYNLPKENSLKCRGTRIPKVKKTYVHTRTKYSVELYEYNKLTQTFDDVQQASEKLKISIADIRLICTGRKKGIDLRYGKKIQKILCGGF